MNINNLDNIKKVEVPPFLYTRIQQKIEFLDATIMPTKHTWAINLSLCLVIVLNIGIIYSYNAKTNSTKNYAESINLISDNSLYNE
jgi:hypothetical protein